MTPVPLDLLRRIANTPPGQMIDIPESEAPGLLFRMATALVAAHEFVGMVDEQPDRVTLTFKHPEAMDAWCVLRATLTGAVE